MTKTGVTHTNTAKGEGGGQLSENPGTKGKTPAPNSGTKYEPQDDKDSGSGKTRKGAGEGD
jgi:hypothetical protein